MSQQWFRRVKKVRLPGLLLWHPYQPLYVRPRCQSDGTWELARTAQTGLLVDAKLALARGDIMQTNVLAVRLVTDRGDDPEVLYFAAVIARAGRPDCRPRAA